MAMILIETFTRFCSIGAIATVLQYAILILLVTVLSVPATFASATGFMISALANYALNYRYTFRSDKKHLDALSKFTTVALIGLVLNTSIMYLFVDLLGVFYLFSQVVATVIVLVFNFLGHNYWSFRT